jgi:hypothetical protein
MATYASNRDGGSKTNEEGHYRFHTKVWIGNVLSGLEVIISNPVGMSVRVTPGDVRIPYSEYAYTAWNDANSTVTVNTADTSNARIDTVVAYIDRSMTFTNAQTNNPGILKFKAVAGTPSSTPTAPTDAQINSSVIATNPWVRLADIYVGQNVASIGTANITDLRSFVKPAPSALQSLYPVGSVYMNATDGTNPASLLGFGVWEVFGAGRVPVGKADSGTFATAGSTGGSETVTLDVSQMPSHNHVQDAHDHVAAYRGYNEGGFQAQGRSALPGGTGTFFSRNHTDARQPYIYPNGGNQPHPNLQPYVVVYMWRRTA